VDGLSPGRAAAAALASVPAGAVVASGGLVCADELPDGVIVADHAARIAIFNKAAARLTGIDALNALGRDVRQVLPLRDTDGRSWWTLVDPYCGLSTRTRHPETSLYLANGTELLVTVGYVRGPRGRDFGARRLGDPGAAGPTWCPPSPTNCARR
jgi:PAS domain-containing protein